MEMETLFPEGQYAMRVERIEDLKLSRTSHYYSRVRLRICGTSHYLIWIISEHPNAEWIWKSAIDSFDDRENLVDRTFLFDLKHVIWDGKSYERVSASLEELVSELDD